MTRYRLFAGGGSAAEDRQAVLVEIDLGPAFAGSWVRAWPQGFDPQAGLHFRLTGGGGRVDAAGVVHLVTTLANGRVDAAGLLSMDMLAAHLDSATGALVQRSYADQRFARPVPDAAAAAAAFGPLGNSGASSCRTRSRIAWRWRPRPCRPTARRPAP